MKNQIKKDLQRLSDTRRAKISSSFFKTGKGQYGEGDIFLGITVPKQREVAKKYLNLPINEIEALLTSRIHEHRLVALIILTEKYNKSSQKEKKEIFDFYLSNAKNINNWDLVDSSADKIAGRYFFENGQVRNNVTLTNLAKSENLWEKRISIISTFYFIKNNEFEETCRISELLLKDKHDLIHKAVGWMLREVGKKDQKAEEDFLVKHYKKMPRTMLRYAIERFDYKKRKFYLEK
ncbi:MAG TPA: DNA alkylation repair protein [Candidatus Nanoarchaeia archaeon]|nr:DNA alkylation repair protein [Candidatus Nanoarchaeia archaeon]